MEHIGSEQLALIVLGKSVHGQDHVNSCPQCTRELDELRDLVVTDPGAFGPVVTNPLWALPEEDRSTRNDDRDEDGDAGRPAPSSTESDSDPTRDDGLAPPSRGAGRGSRRAMWILVGAAAVVGLLLGGIGVAWW